MLPTPPISTLFPYTTLFRSRAEARSYSAEMHSGFGPMRMFLSMDMARSLPMPDISDDAKANIARSEEHTSELQSLRHLVCRLLLENKKSTNTLNQERTTEEY